MPVPYNPLMLWNYTPMLKSVPPPAVNSATEPPLVCVQFSRELLPYIIGAVSLYTWPDKFQGEGADITRAVGVFNDLVALLADAENCPPCEENPMPTAFRFTPACGLEYSNDDGDTWTPVPGWSTDAANCFQGPPGETGDPGAPGDPGEDGQCPDCGDGSTPPTPPTGSTEEIRDELCGIATYLTNWHDQLWRYYLTEASVGVSASQALVLGFAALTTAGVGAVITDALTSFVFDIYSAGIDSVLVAVGPDQIEDIRCLLYCILVEDGGFNADTINKWATEITNIAGSNLGLLYWAAGLPVIGNSAWFFRARIGAADPSNACRILCISCRCGDAITADFRFNSPDMFGWTLITDQTINGNYPASQIPDSPAGVRTELLVTTRGTGTNHGVLGTFVTAGNVKPMGIRRTFEQPFNLCSLAVRFTLFNSSFVANRINTRIISVMILREGETVWEELAYKAVPLNTGAVTETLTWEGEMAVVGIAVIGISGGQYLSIQTVSVNEGLPL